MPPLQNEKKVLRLSGLNRVGIHSGQRDGAKRFQVVKITQCTNGRFVLAAVTGLSAKFHEQDLRLDRDLRKELGVSLDKEFHLEIRKMSWIGTIWWYLSGTDPVFRISAQLALLSVVLSLLSLSIAVFS